MSNPPKKSAVWSHSLLSAAIITTGVITTSALQGADSCGAGPEHFLRGGKPPQASHKHIAPEPAAPHSDVLGSMLDQILGGQGQAGAKKSHGGQGGGYRSNPVSPPRSQPVSPPDSPRSQRSGHEKSFCPPVSLSISQNSVDELLAKAREKQLKKERKRQAEAERRADEKRAIEERERLQEEALVAEQRKTEQLQRQVEQARQKHQKELSAAAERERNATRVTEQTRLEKERLEAETAKQRAKEQAEVKRQLAEKRAKEQKLKEEVDQLRSSQEERDAAFAKQLSDVRALQLQQKKEFDAELTAKLEEAKRQAAAEAREAAEKKAAEETQQRAERKRLAEELSQQKALAAQLQKEKEEAARLYEVHQCRLEQIEKEKDAAIRAAQQFAQQKVAQTMEEKKRTEQALTSKLEALEREKAEKEKALKEGRQVAIQREAAAQKLVEEQKRLREALTRAQEEKKRTERSLLAEQKQIQEKLAEERLRAERLEEQRRQTAEELAIERDQEEEYIRQNESNLRALKAIQIEAEALREKQRVLEQEREHGSRTQHEKDALATKVRQQEQVLEAQAEELTRQRRVLEQMELRLESSRKRRDSTSSDEGLPSAFHSFIPAHLLITDPELGSCRTRNEQLELTLPSPPNRLHHRHPGHDHSGQGSGDCGGGGSPHSESDSDCDSGTLEDIREQIKDLEAEIGMPHGHVPEVGLVPYNQTAAGTMATLLSHKTYIRSTDEQRRSGINVAYHGPCQVKVDGEVDAHRIQFTNTHGMTINALVIHAERAAEFSPETELYSVEVPRRIDWWNSVRGFTLGGCRIFSPFTCCVDSTLGRLFSLPGLRVLPRVLDWAFGSRQALVSYDPQNNSVTRLAGSCSQSTLERFRNLHLLKSE